MDTKVHSTWRRRRPCSGRRWQVRRRLQVRLRAALVAERLVQSALVPLRPEQRDVHPVRPGVRAGREAVLIDHAPVGVALGHEDVDSHLVDGRGARHALREPPHAREVALLP
eukprot:scaffold60056_cov68-Phaeocystis_antarctica.AAC.5